MTIPLSPKKRRLVDYYVEYVSTGKTNDASTDGDILRKIPEVNHEDFPLPDGIKLFCFPGIYGCNDQPKSQRTPSFFTFSLTDGIGARAYGSAILYYEPLLDGRERPHVMCFISHFPYFSLFKSVLRWIYHVRKRYASIKPVEELPQDICIDNAFVCSKAARKNNKHGSPFSELRRCHSSSDLVSQRAGDIHSDGKERSETISLWYRVLVDFATRMPALPPGRITELSIEGTGQHLSPYRISLGNTLPHADDYCFQALFQCLSPRNVVLIVTRLLLEQRVLVHSMHYGLLSAVCEALCGLMCPFTWDHVYIPVLPLKLIDYLQAPVPFIMGVHTSALATPTASQIFATCVVVHLDKDQVVSPIRAQMDDILVEDKVVEFSQKKKDRLISAIKSHLPDAMHLHTGRRTRTGRVQSRRNAATINTSLQLSKLVSPTCAEKSTSYEEVEITFGPGPIGITFESTDLRLLAASNFRDPQRNLNASAVVKSFPRLANGLPGPAELSGLIFAGSYLVAINGQSTLHLSYEDTRARLKSEPRPMRLRFQNAHNPFENACLFASKLKAASLLSVAEADPGAEDSRTWIDRVRGEFFSVFVEIFSEYPNFVFVLYQDQKITSMKPEVRISPTATTKTLGVEFAFDKLAFLKKSRASNREFLREFMETQSFQSFINDSAIGLLKNRSSTPAIVFFQKCIDLLKASKKSYQKAIMTAIIRGNAVLPTVISHLPLPKNTPEQPETDDILEITTLAAEDPDNDIDSAFKSFPPKTAVASTKKTRKSIVSNSLKNRVVENFRKRLSLKQNSERDEDDEEAIERIMR